MRFACRLLLLASALSLGASACNLRKFFDDPRCSTTSDCFDGKVCSANLCVGIGTLGTGRRCWATRDCQDGQTCQLVPITKDGKDILDQRCLGAGAADVGGTCSTSLDCKAGLRCELVGFSGQCQPAGTHDRDQPCTGTGDCLAGLACGPGGTCLPYPEAYPIFAGVTCPDETGGFRAHFEVPRPSAPLVDFFRLPFPSDVRVSAGGKLDLSDFPRPGPTPLGVDLVQLYVDALVTDFEGYSAIAPITFRYSGPVDASSLAQAAVIVDLTDGASFAAEHAAHATSHAARTKYSCADRVIVEHAIGDVLQPRHTYATILRGVKSAGGITAGQDPDLAAVLGGARPTGDEPLGHAWDAHAQLRKWIAQKGVDVASLQGAAVFTVGDAVGTMGKVSAAINASPLPVLSDLTLCGPGVTSPCADGSPDRVCGDGDPAFSQIQGRISIPIFQEGTAPYLKPENGGGIDGVAPKIIRTEQVCFELTVPKQTPPAAGWPLAVYAHGTGGSFHSFVNEQIAAQLATGSKFFAAISYDGVEHGARKNGSTQSTQDLVFNILNPHAARDNVLQSGADVLQLLRVGGITVPASVTGTTISFDPAHVVYFGHSQGANAGQLALPYTSNGRASVLSGSGGGVIDGVLAKTSPINVADGMKFLLGEALDTTHPAMVIFQTYFDRSDPQAYAPMLIRRPAVGFPAKHIFHTYGIGDTYAPPKTLANMTKALGVPLVKPVLEDVSDPASPKVSEESRPVIADLVGGDGQSITAATFQYTPQGYDGHFVALRDGQARADWKFFFESFLVAGTPHVP